MHLPDKFDRFAEDIPDYAPIYKNIDELEEDKDEEIQKAIKERLSEQQLVEVLPSVLDRRGVLIYFNRGIFARHKTVPCPEFEDEIILVGNEPLTQEVISGVEVLNVNMSSGIKRVGVLGIVLLILAFAFSVLFESSAHAAMLGGSAFGGNPV